MVCLLVHVRGMASRATASLKCLTGYCAFHRLLLLAVEHYPYLGRRANSIVNRFISDRRSRTKKVVPALGEFLPLLTVSTATWMDVAPVRFALFCGVYVH